MKKITSFVSLLSVAILSFSPINASVAQEEAKSAKQAKNAITFRQSLFQLVRSNIGPLGAMAKGQLDFDPELMSKNAERMMQLSAMIPDYFALDTSNFPDGSEAKSVIWANMDDFNQKATDLYNAAKVLKSVADAKDKSKYRASIGAVGGTCKACHDDYKAD